MNRTIAFIGGGNMARSLIGGLIARGVDAARMIVADPAPAQLASLAADYALRTTSDNAQAAREADVVVLAVKPQVMHDVVSGLAASLAGRSALLISVAAGIRACDIRRWSGAPAVVRCMPNRPALHGCGVTALYATSDVSAADRRLAQELLDAVGVTLWLEREDDMDAVTAISGSGPAYFFWMVELLEQTGASLGLSPEVSRILARETAFGAGAMVRSSAGSAAELREQVTSPGGTTEAAMKHLQTHGVADMFAAAVRAAARRSTELADEFGKR
ncbi:MAG TPA: pyrroline-5-carboxylate reductase [Steroidobacter sp.]|jgi:pyrroline-5-carboxylate reductase|nr:pyrroline-5-carboxylate reductase [Steroidobacteraceae bacterium]HLS82172.1 pyrroline-5-carboxylate reductase [Steroidobacter sp.]